MGKKDLLLDAKLFTQDYKDYLFLMNGDSVYVYELTPNGKV